MSNAKHCPPDQIELWKGVDGSFRWHYVSANGHKLADGGQGYSRRIDAINGARTVTGLALDLAPFVGVGVHTRIVWDVTR